MKKGHPTQHSFNNNNKNNNNNNNNNEDDDDDDDDDHNNNSNKKLQVLIIYSRKLSSITNLRKSLHVKKEAELCD